MNLKVIMAVVLKTLGISALSKDGDGKSSLTAEQKTKLTDVFGSEFAEKFEAALPGYKEESSAGTTAIPANASAAAVNETETAESLVNALRAHHSNVVARGLQDLQAELATEKGKTTVLQQTVSALSGAAEVPPKAEFPADIPRHATKPSVMKVDYSSALYAGAKAFLNSGNALAYQAATIDVAQLKTEFGKYLSQNQTNLQIIRQLFNGFTSAKYFTSIPAVTEYRAIRALITSVSQQFTAKWTPGGKAKFTPITIKNRRHKINYPIVPAEVLDSYMFHLYDEGLAPDQMPITMYIWNNLIYPALLNDIELRMIWKGKFVDHESTQDEGDPATAPEDSMDGIETILAEAKVSADKGIIFFEKYPDFDFKTATDQAVLNFTEAFVDYISPLYKGQNMPVFCSGDFYKRYKRAYKKVWGVNSGQDGDFGKDKIDFSNNTLTPIDGMYNSPIVFSTPLQNMIKLRHKNEVPNVVNDVQVENYTVKIFGEYWLGVGFAMGEAVIAYVPDGYNPKAKIADTLGDHDDYQSWTPEEFSSEGSGI